MKLDLEKIKSLPITTNRITVAYNKEKFFSFYSVVSYYSLDKEYKNLAYEQLSDLPFVSVCGIRAKWYDVLYPCVRFFVLIKKTDVSETLNSLRSFGQIRVRIDNLEDYTEGTRQRIIASLAINSLGQLKAGKMMYNNASLLLCDDKNFLVSKTRKELVCLKIEVNEYLNLIARTTSFSNPRNEEELRRKGNCVFQVSKDIEGQWWSGLSVKPVVVKKIKTKEINLQDFYIQKKRFADKHNIVPYWPYAPEDYIHGRLFALAQVVDSVNRKFDTLIRIEFTDYNVLLYDEYKPEKEMLSFLTKYLAGKRIYIEDPFKSAASKKLIEQMKSEFQLLMGDSLVFPNRQQAEDLLIKLCEPQEEELPETHYLKSLYRLAFSGRAIQHKIFYGNEKEDTFTKSEARRILIEILVKDCLIRRKMPTQLSALAEEWTFYRYKICDGNVLGASFIVEGEEIKIEEIGFPSAQIQMDFDTFAHTYLHYDESNIICGAKDYMALKKKGNVYLIIDTEEIPILDVSLIDEAYNEIQNGDEPLSLFKRKKIAHQYLRGYIGLHLWKSNGLNGEADGAYSYISGTNSENMQIMKSTKMDRMPRARRIFVLHSENPSCTDQDIAEIENMLRFGFGRWNEMMTYPFPFKFLQEYLDDVCETSFSKHWKDMTSRSEL